MVALGKYPLQPHVSFHISMNITRKEQNVNNFKDRTMYLMNKTQIPFSTLQWMMLLGANQHRAPQGLMRMLGGFVQRRAWALSGFLA